MKRILFIMGDMGLGGAETHIMKVYRKIDKSKYQFDFVLNVEKRCFYQDEISRLGGKIYYVTKKADNIVKNYHDIKKIVAVNKYKCVVKCGQNAMSWTEMLAAKCGGATNRIMRSTNSNPNTFGKNVILHYLSRPLLCSLTTCKVAPSTKAGEWLFGKNGCKNLTIVHNGIDVKQYCYNSFQREKLRTEFGIPKDAIVIGHVGRFAKQKNHAFLIRAFSELLRNNSNAFLMLIGEGNLLESVKKMAEDCHISDKVVFTGNRNDVDQLYSAMDVLALPSLYEGLPNVVIEAQASGLPCVVADTVTSECNISGHVCFLPLDDAMRWAETLETVCGNRYNATQAFETSKYDIESVVQVYNTIFER